MLQVVAYLKEADIEDMSRIILLLCLFADDPALLTAELVAAAEAIPQEFVPVIFNIKYYGGARMYQDDNYQLRVMGGYVDFFGERYGLQIVPPRVVASLPSLFEAGQNPAQSQPTDQATNIMSSPG